MLFFAAENFQLMSDFEAEERMARKMLAVYKFYPRLVSYAFKDMAETVFRLKRLEDISDRVVVIADSGAYTEMKQGKKIDLDDYIEWVQENEKSIYRCVNLDKIGNGLKSFQNYCNMRECDLNPIPVWHLGTEIEYLLEYLKMTDYIGISLRKNSTNERKRILELDPLWHYFLTDGYGQPLKKYHLFGVQSVPIIKRYPWFSADGTEWMEQGKNGCVVIPRQKAGLPCYYKTPYRILVSDRRIDKQAHLSNLASSKKEYITKYINGGIIRFGLNPDLNDWFTRYALNLSYFFDLMWCQSERPLVFKRDYSTMSQRKKPEEEELVKELLKI